MKYRRFESRIDALLRSWRWGAVAATVLLFALAAPATNAVSSRLQQEPRTRPRVERLRTLPGSYIGAIAMYGRGYAELASSLGGSIDGIRSRLHCRVALFTERLQASGLSLPGSAVTDDDGCAL